MYYISRNPPHQKVQFQYLFFLHLHLLFCH
nr:MAG TPA_asm: hypothetical protein [Caudoviricetes sp.]